MIRDVYLGSGFFSILDPGSKKHRIRNTDKFIWRGVQPRYILSQVPKGLSTETVRGKKKVKTGYLCA
jgi:hypothetical protein